MIIRYDLAAIAIVITRQASGVGGRGGGGVPLNDHSVIRVVL